LLFDREGVQKSPERRNLPVGVTGPVTSTIVIGENLYETLKFQVNLRKIIPCKTSTFILPNYQDV